MASRPARTGIARCPGCDEKIIRALLDGAIITLDRLPDSQGLVKATHEVNGTWRAQRHTPGTHLDAIWKQFAVHDCGAEKAAEPPPGVAQIDQWRRAQAAASRRRRTRRARGTAAPAAGYRTWPGGQR